MCGIQAQDVRSAGLALRSRVPGLTRAAVRDAGLVRTWTVRGTLHLIAPEDRAWLHALCAPRFLPRMERALEQRGHLDTARGMLGRPAGAGGGRAAGARGAARAAGRARPRRAERRGGERAAAVGGAPGAGGGHRRRALGGARTRRSRWTRTRRWPPWAGATWRATGRRATATWRPGRACRWAGRGARWSWPGRWTRPPRPSRRRARCWRRSTRRCWAGRRASRWWPPGTRATCCRAAGCSGRWCWRGSAWWARGGGARRRSSPGSGPSRRRTALAAEVADVERFLAS